MITPPVIPQKIDVDQAKKIRDSRVSPEMRKEAEGLESVFTSELMKTMRGTVEPSEFSLHNSATDIYQGMLDQEYSDVAARQNSLGLSEQIIDYWLRSQPSPQYNQEKNLTQGSVSTGGTHEDQSRK